MVFQSAVASCLERSQDMYFVPLWLSERDKWLPPALSLSSVGVTLAVDVFWRTGFGEAGSRATCHLSVKDMIMFI